jgi:excisionase family DNA binding protein
MAVLEKQAANPNLMQMTILLTIKEACARLNISRSQIRCLIRAGRIRAVPIGSRGVRIPLSELDRFVSDGMDELAPEEFHA